MWSVSARKPNPMDALFNHPLADVIIRSSDCADFRMSKLELARLSPVFEDMFCLGEQCEGSPSQEMMEGCPVVRLDDSLEDMTQFLTVLFDGAQCVLFSSVLRHGVTAIGWV